MLSLFRCAAALLLVSAASVVHAHDTWLFGPTNVPPGAPATFGLTSSGAFPAPEGPSIEPSRVARSSCRLGGRDVAFEVGAPGERALSLTVRPASAGVATCGLALNPKTLELTPDEVAHYLEEIGATRTIGPKWQAAPEPRRWRETYVKNTKAFVRVGDAADESWREPIGLALEIVPLADPTRLRAGATLEVRLLRAGQPLAGLALRASHQGRTPIFATTGKDGRASFPLETPGSWLLAATEIRPGATRPSEWESDFTTLYLEVAP